MIIKDNDLKSLSGTPEHILEWGGGFSRGVNSYGTMGTCYIAEPRNSFSTKQHNKRTQLLVLR